MSREIDEIKQRLDIVEIVGEYVQLKKAGSNHKAPCLFHQEKSPSFMVSQPKQIFHCFGCHKGGDMFSFVQEIEGVDFYEALKILADKAGVKLQKKQGVNKQKKDSLLDILSIASELFHKLLLDHPKAQIARDYVQSRGLSQETIKDFQIGYAPDSWDTVISFFEKKGISKAMVLQAGLAVHNQERNSVYDRFRHRLMIPLLDVYGNVVGFTARALGDDFHGGKYINTPQTEVYDKSSVVFGLSKAKQAIKEAGYVVIVEGNMDVIASHQAGVMPVVAVSGTALTPLQLKQLKRFTQTCIFSFDADDAGVNAAKRSAAIALQLGMDVKALTLPQGKDPDECIAAGVHLWKQAIDQAEPIVDYFIRLGINKYDVSTPTGKKQLAQEVIRLLSYVKNPVEKDHYLQKLAQVLNTSMASLQELLQSSNQEHTQNNQASQSTTPEQTEPEEQPQQRIETPFEVASKELLALLLTAKEKERELFSEEYLHGEDYKSLYKWLKSTYSDGSQSDDQHLRSLPSNLQIHKDHLELFADQAFDTLSDAQRRDAIAARKTFLQRQYLKTQLHSVQLQLQEAERKKEQDTIAALTQQFQQLSQQLMQLD